MNIQTTVFFQIELVKLEKKIMIIKQLIFINHWKLQFKFGNTRTSILLRIFRCIDELFLVFIKRGTSMPLQTPIFNLLRTKLIETFWEIKMSLSKIILTDKFFNMWNSTSKQIIMNSLILFCLLTIRWSEKQSFILVISSIWIIRSPMFLMSKKNPFY